MVKIIPTLHDVTIEGVKIKRPDRIAPSDWLSYWGTVARP